VLAFSNETGIWQYYSCIGGSPHFTNVVHTYVARRWPNVHVQQSLKSVVIRLLDNRHSYLLWHSSIVHISDIAATSLMDDRRQLCLKTVICDVVHRYGDKEADARPITQTSASRFCALDSGAGPNVSVEMRRWQ
jgi:hypothetical protein